MSAFDESLSREQPSPGCVGKDPYSYELGEVQCLGDCLGHSEVCAALALVRLHPQFVDDVLIRELIGGSGEENQVFPAGNQFCDVDLCSAHAIVMCALIGHSWHSPSMCEL